MDVDKLLEMKRIAFEMKNWKEVRRINKMIEFNQVRTASGKKRARATRTR